MSQSRLGRIVRFCFVGCLGFIVDFFIVFALTHWFDLGPVLARIPAWIAAVTTTYIFNLLYTFRVTKLVLVGQKKRLLRYGLYVLSQLSGGAVNLLSYAMVVSVFHYHWLIGLIVGTLLGIIFNYFGASSVINRKKVGRL